MKAVVISDREYQTAQYERIHAQLGTYLVQKKFEVEEISVGRGEIAHCIGCFGCWIKTPGECVIHDDIAQINRACMASDAVFYLMPVVFGQFSANMANVINRWLPNMLPFFMIRPDGSTMHPPRYDQYPAQVMVGYGDAIAEEDAQLFMDINLKHRSNAQALVCRTGVDMEQQLRNISLVRTGGML